MGRILTWCLVAAVAAIGLVAGIDAVRGGGQSEPPTTTAPAEPPEDSFAEARADLRAAGVPTGRLTYADEECRNHVVTIPDLLPDGPPSGYAGLCRYRAVGGGRVETVGPPSSPDSSVRRFTRCPGDHPLAPLRCSRPVLTRAQLAGQLRGVPWSGYVLSIKELHWLDNQRFAAIMRARSADGPSDYLVIFARGRLVQEPTFAYADLRGIRPSPSGRFVAAYDEGRGGLVVVNREGESVQLAMDHGDGISWSPDEEWIAEATEDGIYVFRADEDSPEFIHIPVVATDLLWE
jgi:hypothetical protein